MSDLSFVAGEFTGLAATSREAAEAVRSARPEGGGSAFASAMPGTSLSSQMQGAEEKIADRGMDNAKGLDEAADSLELSERDFIAAEEENGQLVGSIMSAMPWGTATAASGRVRARQMTDDSMTLPGQVVAGSYDRGCPMAARPWRIPTTSGWAPTAEVAVFKHNRIPGVPRSRQIPFMKNLVGR